MLCNTGPSAPTTGSGGRSVWSSRSSASAASSRCGEYSAHCHFNNGAGWLQVEGHGAPHDPAEFVPELLGRGFGLHLFDGKITLGNTVRMIGLQAQGYLFENDA